MKRAIIGAGMAAGAMIGAAAMFYIWMEVRRQWRQAKQSRQSRMICLQRLSLEPSPTVSSAWQVIICSLMGDCWSFLTTTLPHLVNVTCRKYADRSNSIITFRLWLQPKPKKFWANIWLTGRPWPTSIRIEAPAPMSLMLCDNDWQRPEMPEAAIFRHSRSRHCSAPNNWMRNKRWHALRFNRMRR